MGSSKLEVTIAEVTALEAGMIKGRYTPNIRILGHYIDNTIGGHYCDMLIADKMQESFKKQYPQLAEDFDKNSKAKRRILVQAKRTRHTLSAVPSAKFDIESLFNGEDFSEKISREDFEEMMKPMFDRVTDPIKECLKKCNLTWSDIHQFQVIGQAWRTPKIKQNLQEFLEIVNAEREEHYQTLLKEKEEKKEEIKEDTKEEAKTKEDQKAEREMN
jgi:molecular chaperone DnaK (HSP70)